MYFLLNSPILFGIGTCEPIKRKPRKMVKHTQTIPCQQPTNCSSVFNYFVVLAIKGLKK